jgi:hypothetical protein
MVGKGRIQEAGTETTEPESEEAEVFAWRLEQFASLGFSQHDSIALAVSDADLGCARELQRGRCPHELALAILL